MFLLLPRSTYDGFRGGMVTAEEWAVPSAQELPPVFAPAMFIVVY